ncbi:transmembrane anchor protein [Thaumasiovibrio subtropicus]|uniref:transmembrane anchor protein n=1 Tax=Thaumasiovibrio subtropicus TaxID=1891207 RepID=UPI000B363D28|nr:transmembrane anchor protein [Thaumasiovibrio subtropicus]
MFNAEMPPKNALPSSKQLLRSTLIALISAAVLLVTVILPAEYGIDPTGVGRTLGLTEMGEIKTQLAAEAENDRVSQQPTSTSLTHSAETAKVLTHFAHQETIEWQDRVLLTLSPGEGAEVKFALQSGETMQFSWEAKGGAVNVDAHGDNAEKMLSYEKGRGKMADSGELTAPFSGHHGWFFRNRNDELVMVIIKARGEYSAIKRY